MIAWRSAKVSLLGLCLMLGACAAVPLHVRLDPPIPPDHVFVLRDGTVLPARSWLPPAGTRWRGIILALHGFTDSRDGFELAGPDFARAGYAVIAPDQRGFGGTASRGTWPGAARLIEDAAEVAGQLRATYPGKRLILLGESMGGAIALCLAARPHPPADAFVLLAPAVWGWGQLDPRLAALLFAADHLAPGWAPNPNQVPGEIVASDNFDALRRMGRDPLTLRRPTVATLRGLVDLMTMAQRAVPRLHGAVLILSGGRDMIVPPAATSAAWSRLPAEVRRGFYPNGYHLLLRDHDRALVEADILAWLAAPDGWLPSGADVAAGAWEASRPWSGGPAEALPAGGLDGAGLRTVWPF